MSRSLFVTGTDTGVGKTLVSCALAAAFRARGEGVAVWKPVETGCAERDGLLQAEDAERLREASGSGQASAAVCSQRFRAPAAPLAAAEAEGRSIDPAALLAEARAQAEGCDRLLIEGAGGLLVPIAEGFDFADLAVALAAPVLLVVGSKLGCLNHARLSLEALERRGLEVRGWVLNELTSQPAEQLAHATHRDLLRRSTPQPDLGHLPFVPEPARDDFAALASLAERHLELARL